VRLEGKKKLKSERQKVRVVKWTAEVSENRKNSPSKEKNFSAGVPKRPTKSFKEEHRKWIPSLEKNFSREK